MTQEFAPSTNCSDEEMVEENDSDIFRKCKQTSGSITRNHTTSDEENTPVVRVKKRLQLFTNSESDTDQENTCLKNKLPDIEDEATNKISSTREGSSSKEDSNSDDDKKSIKNEEQQLRMKNKRNKLRNKFKSLITSRSKEVSKNNTDSENEQHPNNSSNLSGDDESSINNIKQGIKKSMLFKTAICDPDTSDEEDLNKKRDKMASKSLQQKKTKPTSPKPLRMTAKLAMENMKKIKSESNRLLREKEVSLPYHRPKAFSLKDIMSRRKPAITADGKALPIKMNDEQLKQYAQMLEQRQKEIMDLCKSDSEEECSNEIKNQEHSSNINTANDTIENNKNLSTNVLPDDLNAVCDTPAEGNSHISHEKSKSMDLDCHKVSELDNTSNIEVAQSVLDNSSCLEVVINNRLEDEKKTKIDGNSKTAECLARLQMAPKGDNVKETFTQNMDITEKPTIENVEKHCTEPKSQMINLHYESENTLVDKIQVTDNKNTEDKSEHDENMSHENDFSDSDIDMDDIDNLIENAEILNDISCDNNTMPSMVMGTTPQLLLKPKLTGAPGMVIDLEENDSSMSKRLSGVELLKERFTYFSKLKTPEELEREKEKKLKPGAQHLKLKQELEDIIAEQRSLEWAKRLNEEKQQQMELKALRGEESDVEDDIEKIEAQIDENDVEHEETSDEGESEPEEDDIKIKDKPRTKNAMINDEADESDCDDDVEKAQSDVKYDDNDINKGVDEDSDASSDEESSDESSDDELERETTNARKGRILKAFEDSDDDTESKILEDTGRQVTTDVKASEEKQHYDLNYGAVQDQLANEKSLGKEMEAESQFVSEILKDSQDDEIQLAQRVVSGSDDMFTSQESIAVVPTKSSQDDENILGTQTFSILNPSNNIKDGQSNLECTQKLNFISDTQISDGSLDTAVPVCSATYTQNFIPSHLSSSQPPIDQSQAIGEDVLALCTGKFYDNQFISQSEENGMQDTANVNFDDIWSKDESQEDETDMLVDSSEKLKDMVAKDNETKDNDGLRDKTKSEGKAVKGQATDQTLLQSIIDELHDEDEQESLKPNKYFVRDSTNSDANNQVKKKFVIESDDELNGDTTERQKKKKVKKKKLEHRALQISDDEQEESDDEEYHSELENETDRVVEYDSEENEIEVKQQNPKKKRKGADFFENEAELTSEDEWVGSGDEDEAGLDRMEREEGDDETFHQGKLQRELGQIHMRDVLDQDKREVRLIQELLFEDGDLGDGHRQRKFRWKNADGADEPDTVVDDFADTQEEEFESEEQWRKQRHEREVYLRQMKEQENPEASPNVTLNRSSIIKANLSSKSMSSLLLEVNNTSTSIKTDVVETSTVKEKAVKDIPSPKRGFSILQQNYHSSLLTRGRGALARLAALATPLAIDEDSTKVATVAPQNQRNFVFASVTKEDDKPKVKKRKADSKIDTPRLVKKLKTNEKQTFTRNSLLDHLKI